MDKALNIPILNRSLSTIPVTDVSGITGATTETIKHVNYNLLRVLSTRGPPGAAALGFQQPCVHWFGENYPKSALYEQPVDNTTSPLQLRDRYY